LKGAVLDSFAVLAYLREERGADRIREILESAIEKDVPVLISAPNWGEIRYIIERKSGRARWDDVRAKLLGLPLEIVPLDRDAAEQAGAIKATHAMSYTDCCAAQLAKDRGLPVYTGDPEFKLVEDQIRIVWL
jgi:predicted nucleic acid-binding protein